MLGAIKGSNVAVQQTKLSAKLSTQKIIQKKEACLRPPFHLKNSMDANLTK
jgi:hypothetical protein